MATTTSHGPTESPHAELTKEQFDDLIAFFRDYYRDEIGTFLQQYPDDTTQFPIAFDDLERGVSIDVPGTLDSFAEHYVNNPEAYDDHLVDALDHVDMPVKADLSGATVQVTDLPE